jgi:succinylglutamic semialdehyde dehydrogenase
MDVRGNYIGGQFVVPAAPDAELESRNPGNLDELLGRYPVAVAAVDAAIAAAHAAQHAWGDAPLAERVAALKRIGAELKAREDAFTDIISREVGKPRWEARTEAKAMVAKVDVTLEDGLRWITNFTPANLNGECRFRPHGVLAVIGPFNFPGHLPNGHILPALVAGNCVVYKPSEAAPGVGQLYAEALDAAKLPPGVFNLVQGARSVGERLSVAPGIDGLLFTGSVQVGLAIQKANLESPGKLLALELGGKNASIVCEDADLDKALYDILFSAYVTCGQRCSATSRALVHRSLVDRFTERMAALVKKLKIGVPAHDPFMGPLTTLAGKQKFLDGMARAPREGAAVVVEAGALELSSVRGHYVTPGLHRIEKVLPDSLYQREELFGPDLAIYAVDSLEEAIALSNDVPYGLTAAVFTRDAAKFERCASRLEAGVINWNAPTVGSSSRLPFGGLKKSGNHRPAGVFSTLYCAYPVAITRGDATLNKASLAPGVSWE